MVARFLGAVQFLTVVPIPARTTEPGRAAVFFPLVAGLAGAIAAALYIGMMRVWPASLSAALVLTFLIALSGGLHEDGLADVADAFRAGRTPSRILAILKDSRIGAYGAVAIGLSILVRWQALAVLGAGPRERLLPAMVAAQAVSRGVLGTGPRERLLPAMVAAQAVSRGAVVALAWMARPAGTGLGAGFAGSLTSTAAVLAIAQAYAAALWCGPGTSAAIVASAGLLTLAARGYFERRLGGVNGDCLGSLSPIVESTVLLVVAWGN
jgi:adenosylcobinamide-GDP ribazoletransferase